MDADRFAEEILAIGRERAELVFAFHQEKQLRLIRAVAVTVEYLKAVNAQQTRLRRTEEELKD